MSSGAGDSAPVRSSTVNQIPASLRRFLDSGGTKYRGDDGDWEIKVESEVPAHLVKSITPEALVIGNNGCGDYLYLIPEPDSPAFAHTVFVFWHDEGRIERYLLDIDTLAAPPEPAPSPRPPVRYFGGETPVQVGDHVTVRGVVQFWRRFPGRVSYVPGISKKNRNLEHGGLAWVGIKLDKGHTVGIFVEEKSGCILKKVSFLSRSTSPVQELGPLEDSE